MPKAVKPANFRTRATIRDEPIEYAPSWTTVPFDSYEGMTQQQFQDATFPYAKHGKLVPITVPKGWRRVESTHPGTHFYVHMETGAISKVPQEIYNSKKNSWITRDGNKVGAAELEMDPLDRALQLVQGVKPLPAAIEAPEVSKTLSTKEAAPTPTPEVKKEEAPPPAPMPELEPPLPVGLLFPGQGSQYVKMLKEVKDLPAVKEMIEVANEILGYDLLQLCLKGPESKLEQTKFTQPAMFVGGLAAVEKLKKDKPERVERCQAVAGLSLGEYTALCVAGVFDFKTGLKIVKLRGEAMQEAAEASEQSMLSVAGLDEATVTKLCQEAKESEDDVCQIANFLFPKGYSCAGSAAAIQKLSKAAQKTEGCLQARVLKTSGGFHTSLMRPAREALTTYLNEVVKEMKPPRCNVYMNLTGKPITPATKPEEIVPMLADQLMNCVQWEPAVREMIKDGVSEFYECGPMKQLKAMMKRIDPNAFKFTSSVEI